MFFFIKAQHTTYHRILKSPNKLGVALYKVQNILWLYIIPKKKVKTSVLSVFYFSNLLTFKFLFCFKRFS